MAKKKLSEKQEELVVNLYRNVDKESIASIAEKFGVRPNTIRKILLANEVEIRKVSRKILKSEEKNIIDTYKSNKAETLTSIGRKYGVSRGTIKRILIDNNIDVEYDRSPNRNVDIDKYADEIVDLFVNKKWSRNKIAKKYNTSHIVIRRVLVQNGVIEDNYFQETNIYKIEVMVKNLRSEYEVDFDFFKSIDEIDKLDINKLSLLNNRSKRIVVRSGFILDYKSYIRKFYFDEQFNAIYQAWIESGKNKWLSPSIDHMVPVARGGSPFELNNLQFLTWFENRAKCDMTEEEWSKFKIESNTTSDYYIRV